MTQEPHSESDSFLAFDCFLCCLIQSLNESSFSTRGRPLLTGSRWTQRPSQHPQPAPGLSRGEGRMGVQSPGTLHSPSRGGDPGAGAVGTTLREGSQCNILGMVKRRRPRKGVPGLSLWGDEEGTISRARGSLTLYELMRVRHAGSPPLVASLGPHSAEVRAPERDVCRDSREQEGGLERAGLSFPRGTGRDFRNHLKSIYKCGGVGCKY